MHGLGNSGTLSNSIIRYTYFSITVVTGFVCPIFAVIMSTPDILNPIPLALTHCGQLSSDPDDLHGALFLRQAVGLEEGRVPGGDRLPKHHQEV